MKTSQYNYGFCNKGKFYLFNGITYKFIKFDISLKPCVEELLRMPNEDWGEMYSFKLQLYNAGFLIDDDVNELERLFGEMVKNRSVASYSLMILPTYDCNFSCWYCIQSHKHEYMSGDIVESIKKHIATYLLQNDIKSFDIHWFGGEPLLCFDSHIVEISNYAINFCKTHGIDFHNSITTNGYLLNEDMILRMKDLNFRQFQITLDGSREFHNQTRNEQGIPSYDRIVNNVHSVVEMIPNVKMFLRYNFTKENYTSLDRLVQDLNTVFEPDCRSKVFISVIKVWQEDREKIDKDCFDNIFSAFTQAGYSIADIDLSNDYIRCNADKLHSYVIFHNGKVDKCNNIPPSEAAYELLDSGKISIINKKNNDILSVDVNCKKCKLFPVCLGPCFRDLNMNKVFECAETNCNISVMERVKNYCLRAERC